jgi:hypothetical protein
MRRRTILFFAFAMPALSQPKVDVSGKWKGHIEMTTPDGQKHDDPFALELTQTGTVVTGLARQRGGVTSPLQDVALQQRQLTFSITIPTGAVLRFKLDLIDDTHMEGTASVEWEGKVVDAVTTTVKLVKE